MPTRGDPDVPDLESRVGAVSSSTARGCGPLPGGACGGWSLRWPTHRWSSFPAGRACRDHDIDRSRNNENTCPHSGQNPGYGRMTVGAGCQNSLYGNGIRRTRGAPGRGPGGAVPRRPRRARGPAAVVDQRHRTGRDPGLGGRVAAPAGRARASGRPPGRPPRPRREPRRHRHRQPGGPTRPGRPGGTRSAASSSRTPWTTTTSP